MLCVYLFGIDPAYLWYNMLRYTDTTDVAIGLIKAFIFGGIVALVGCYKGLSCGEGAEGVGTRHDRGGRLFLHHHPDLEFLPHAVAQRHPGQSMIEVRDLKKSFGANGVLDGVSFRIEKGESVVIIGRSGGGKSVLLKHLIGLLKPDAGQVLIDGEDIVPMNERELLRVRRKFGMLFQGAALFDSMTVAENVGFAFRRDRKLPPRRKSGERWPRCWKWWTCPAPRTKNRPNCPAA